LRRTLACFAPAMVTGSWCSMAGALPPSRWHHAAQSSDCDRTVCRWSAGSPPRPDLHPRNPAIRVKTLPPWSRLVATSMSDITRAALLCSCGSPVARSVGGECGHVGAAGPCGRAVRSPVQQGCPVWPVEAAAGDGSGGVRDRRVAGLGECPAGRVRLGARAARWWSGHRWWGSGGGARRLGSTVIGRAR
jgi:hypothetical protein